MKKLFFLLVLANLLLDVLTYFLLPGNVATHFAAGGLPNGWFSAVGSLLFNLGLHGLFILVIYAMSTALLKVPKELVSLPNRDYWLSGDRFPLFQSKWERAAFQLGCGLMVFFLLVSLLILDANFSRPVQLNAKLFVSALASFLLFMLYWIFSLYRTFRLPK